MARAVVLFFIVLLCADSAMSARRFDPYRNFHFRLTMDGRVVAGFGKVAGLKATSTAGSLTLERGLTHDVEFEKWAGAAFAGNGAVNMRIPKKDLIVEVLDETGHVTKRYVARGCWVTAFQALPDLDANASRVAIQHMKLENEGWQRDESVTEPKEPSF